MSVYAVRGHMLYADTYAVCALVRSCGAHSNAYGYIEETKHNCAYVYTLGM
jgi:hypothetical protein